MSAQPIRGPLSVPSATLSSSLGIVGGGLRGSGGASAGGGGATLMPTSQRLAVGPAAARAAPVALGRHAAGGGGVSSAGTVRRTPSTAGGGGMPTLAPLRRPSIGSTAGGAPPQQSAASKLAAMPNSSAQQTPEIAPGSAPQMSADALRIMNEINNFDFGGKLGALMSAMDEDDMDSGGGSADHISPPPSGRVAAAAAIVPTPPRQRPPMAATASSTAGPDFSSPRTQRLQQQQQSTTVPPTGTSAAPTQGHEMACGDDEPLPYDDGTHGPNGERRGGSSSQADASNEGGPLAHLRPANFVGFNTSSRAKQQAALSYYDDDNPDVVVMAQKVTLLSNYTSHGGPLWAEAEAGGNAPAISTGESNAAGPTASNKPPPRTQQRHVSSALPDRKKMAATAAFCAKASKGLYFNHLLGQIKLREAANV